MNFLHFGIVHKGYRTVLVCIDKIAFKHRKHKLIVIIGGVKGKRLAVINKHSVLIINLNAFKVEIVLSAILQTIAECIVLKLNLFYFIAVGYCNGHFPGYCISADTLAGLRDIIRNIGNGGHGSSSFLLEIILVEFYLCLVCKGNGRNGVCIPVFHIRCIIQKVLSIGK